MALELTVEPVDRASFAPFGALVFEPGDAVAPRNDRRAALSALEVLSAPPPSGTSSHRIELMERHAFSSQTFFPLEVASYLVVVCPAKPEGGPDVARSRAFEVPGDVVMQYHPDVWHAGITALGGQPGRFAMLIHQDGTDADCEFVPVPPIEISLSP
jgi:ureidoglycolate lyase